MQIIQQSEAAAFRAFDRREAADMTGESWTPMKRRAITDAEIEQFIADFADSGRIEDELGAAKILTNTLFHAVAIDWIDNRQGIPGTTYTAFYAWAKAAATLAICGEVTT